MLQGCLTETELGMMSVSQAVIGSAAKDALDVQAALIIVISSTGDVARLASKYRPKVRGAWCP